MTDHPAIPNTAMVLAAGLGTRMRPLTDDKPKAMVELHGKPLIGHVMDRLAATGIAKAVVNLHYMGEQIRDYLKGEDRLEVFFSDEPERLETGGGIRNALKVHPDASAGQPFFAINADAFWLDGYEDTLVRLAREWRDETMDALLLLHSTVYGHGYEGTGDFVADELGRLARRPESEVSPWLFAGIQIFHPRLFEDTPDGPFSTNLLFDRALAAERLYGVIHDGEWFHIGTPEGLTEADAFLDEQYAGEKKR